MGMAESTYPHKVTLSNPMSRFQPIMLRCKFRNRNRFVRNVTCGVGGGLGLTVAIASLHHSASYLEIPIFHFATWWPRVRRYGDNHSHREPSLSGPVGSLPVPRFSDRYSFLQGCDRQPGTAGGITEAKISNLQSPPRTAAGSALHRHDQGVCHFWPLSRIISFFILQCISDPSHWRGPFGASCPLSTTERHVAHWTIPARALRPWRCYRRDDVVTPWESSLRLALTSTVVISIHTVLRPVSDGDRSKAAAQYDRNVMT